VSYNLEAFKARQLGDHFKIIMVSRSQNPKYIQKAKEHRMWLHKQAPDRREDVHHYEKSNTGNAKVPLLTDTLYSPFRLKVPSPAYRIDHQGKKHQLQSFLTLSSYNLLTANWSPK
jgi:hypothetical protein